MAAVQPLVVYDQKPAYAEMKVEISESDDEQPGYKKKEGGGGVPGVVLCCCPCCVCLLLMGGSIASAIASIGWTNCPAANPLLPNASTGIPPRHKLIRDFYQGSSASSSSMGRGVAGSLWHETDLFNPDVSNKTRVGYWRDTKSWYLRGQWAYVEEGGSEPAAVAWQPFFTWTRTYEVKWCFPPKQYTASQNHVWFWSQLPKNGQLPKWSIAQNGVTIAISDAVKHLNRGFLFYGQIIPQAWNAMVTSTSSPGTIIGNMTQIRDSWYPTKAVWEVDVNRTDLVDPFVLSFMSATFEDSSRRRR
jgi:hypothetical protein